MISSMNINCYRNFNCSGKRVMNKPFGSDTIELLWSQVHECNTCSGRDLFWSQVHECNTCPGRDFVSVTSSRVQYLPQGRFPMGMPPSTTQFTV